MAFSSNHSSNTDRLISETNNKLKQGFHNLCCKLDSLGSKDYELFIACDSVTGAPVIVTYGYDSIGALTITYTNIDGTPAANTVTKCPEKDYELLNFQWFCNSTTLESISRTDLYINGVFDSYIWQDIAGNVIPTPLPTTYTIGACQAPLPVKQERDLEKICYTLDGGLTTQSGWKRFTEIYDQNTNSYIASSFEILDINSNVLPTAIEAKCPEYTYLPVCDNVIATLNNGVVGASISGSNPDDITFSFSNFLVDPTDSLVSDIFISYDCEVTNLNGLLGPIPSITVVFKDTNFPNNINFPAGTYIFKRLTKTLSGFEYLRVITVNWDGTDFATPTTTITSNSNMGFVNQYVISSTHIYSVLDADGTFVKYITSDGATYTPSYNIGDCVESLTTKYTNDCVKQIPVYIPFEIVCIDNGVTQVQAQLIKELNVNTSEITDKFYTIEPNPVEILVNPTDIINVGKCYTTPTTNMVGLELYQNITNGTQASTFGATEVTISYYPDISVTTPITVTLLGTFVGTPTFEIFPNNQETRKFQFPNITGVAISGAIGNTVSIEFQLN